MPISPNPTIPQQTRAFLGTLMPEHVWVPGQMGLEKGSCPQVQKACPGSWSYWLESYTLRTSSWGQIQASPK